MTRVSLKVGAAGAVGVLAMALAASTPTLRPLLDPDAGRPAGVRDAEPHLVPATEFDRAEVLQQMREMPRYEPATGKSLPGGTGGASPSTWEFLGPGNIGGRTRALVIDPVEPDTMYAGGVTGGIWKTTDGGQMWRPVGDHLPNMNIASLAMDPLSRNVLYAGTGEIAGTGFGIGDGIFKSEDAGETWRHLGTPLAVPNELPPFWRVPKIVVSPNSPGRVYAAAHGGLYRSIDGGETWQRVQAPPASGVRRCTDLAIRSDRAPDNLIAVCNTSPAHVLRSTDGGDTWTPVLEQPDSGRITLAIAPQDQDVVFALASHRSYIKDYLGLFRSDDGGATWVTVNHGDTDCHLVGIFGGFGIYRNVVAVDPMDINRIWVAGDDISRSDDGGLTWGFLGLNDHVDRHAIVFHPRFDGTTNTTVFIGSDGGVSKTEDSRTPLVQRQCIGEYRLTREDDQTRWTRLNNHYGVTQFYRGAVSVNGTRFMGGTQDNGDALGTLADGPNRWKQLVGGDSGRSAFDPGNPDVLLISGLQNALFKSVDGGQTFRGLTFGPVETARFMAMDPNNPQILWMENEYLWRSTDQGETWTKASPSLGPRGPSAHGAVAVAPGNSNHVLFAKHGTIYRTSSALSTDEYTQWASTDVGGIDAYSLISSVVFEPGNASIVYATSTRERASHLWKSSDGGTTWVAHDDPANDRGLPDLPVWTIAVDPDHPRRLFVGTEFGIFVSLDGGTTWMVDGAGFPKVPTPELVIRHTAQGPFLYAFTHGRGAYRLDISAYAPQPDPFSFIDQTGVTPGAVVTSSPVTVSGLEAPAPISVQGGTYSIGCTATFTSASGMIGTGQTVCVRHTAAGSYNATTDTVLTVQGVSDTFSSTTRAASSAQPAADAGGGGAALGWGLLWFLAGMAGLRVGARGGLKSGR